MAEQSVIIFSGSTKMGCYIRFNMDPLVKLFYSFVWERLSLFAIFSPSFFFLWSIIADLFLFNYYKQLIFSCLHLEIYKVYKATTIDNLTCVGEKLGAFDSMVVFVPSHLEGYEFNHREFSTLLPSKLGPSSLVSKKKKKWSLKSCIGRGASSFLSKKKMWSLKSSIGQGA